MHTFKGQMVVKNFFKFIKQLYKKFNANIISDMRRHSWIMDLGIGQEQVLTSGKQEYKVVKQIQRNSKNGITLEHFSIACHKTKTRPITYQLHYSANLKPW